MADANGRADLLLSELDVLASLEEADARRLLMSEVEQLRACEVRVYWPRTDWQDDERARLIQYLDDGVYVVKLNPTRPFVEQVAVLEDVWTAWLEPNDPAWWVVQSAKPDDLDTLPVRYTTFLVDGDRG